MPKLSDSPIQRYVKYSRNDHSGYWLDAYGWIACYFAQLEGLSYSLIHALVTNGEKLKLSKLPYQARTEKAKDLVCEYLKARGDFELATEWEKFLTEAKAAAAMRNKILHNPLTINLALGEPLDDNDAGIVLIHEADQPILKLGAVQEFSTYMLDLNLRMHGLLMRSKLVSKPP